MYIEAKEFYPTPKKTFRKDHCRSKMAGNKKCSGAVCRKGRCCRICSGTDEKILYGKRYRLHRNRT